jgi:hypothetical protein
VDLVRRIHGNGLHWSDIPVSGQEVIGRHTSVSTSYQYFFFPFFSHSKS